MTQQIREQIRDAQWKYTGIHGYERWKHRQTGEISYAGEAPLPPDTIDAAVGVMRDAGYVFCFLEATLHPPDSDGMIYAHWHARASNQTWHTLNGSGNVFAKDAYVVKWPKGEEHRDVLTHDQMRQDILWQLALACVKQPQQPQTKGLA